MPVNLAAYCMQRLLSSETCTEHQRRVCCAPFHACTPFKAGVASMRGHAGAYMHGAANRSNADNDAPVSLAAE